MFTSSNIGITYLQSFFKMWKNSSVLFVTAVFVIASICLEINGVDKPVSKVPDDIRLKAPWVAAIFKKSSAKNDDWEFICSGTITGRYTIITSARCLTPRVISGKVSTRPYHTRYTDLQVVVGLPTTSLSSKDERTQFGIVGQIRDVFNPSANGDTPEGDLASIRLKNVLNVSTPYVRAVQLLEKSGTLLEAKETKSGETLLFAGYEQPQQLSVASNTRSQDKGSPLKIQEIVIDDTGTCIDRYSESYQTFYFNALCGKMGKKTDTIPCRYVGSGLVKHVKDLTGEEEFYLFGVYSSNSALAKTEGTQTVKNELTQSACTPADIIYFAKYTSHGRWAVSNNFCDNALAMCQNDKCRPWTDLCNSQVDCDDGSDETDKICFHQNTCEKTQFKCDYGACIDKKLVCDGIQDCKDGSDEDKQGICKEKLVVNAGDKKMCSGIKGQESVTAHCSNSDRSGLIPCQSNVPVGTTAVLRSKEVVVKCQRDGTWSRSTRLTC